MSYPPGSPGYPSASPQAPQYSAAPQYNPPQEPVPAGPSKLPLYLSIAVVVLGLAVYLASYGPLFTASGGDYYTPTLLSIGIVLSVAAALLQGTGLLPNQKDPIAVVSALSVLGFLLHILIVISVPSGVSIDWALYLILAFSLLQAIAAVGALLLESGVITAPVPKPKYEQHPQQQYNPYGTGPTPYYGQPQQQPHQAPQQFQGPPQRPNYPPQQQYGGYPAAPSTAVYNPGSSPLGGQSGPPTPPTGFPAYGQPQPPASSSPTSVLQQQPSSPSPSSSAPAQQPSEDESAPPPS
jgi:Family of unknown function (DUF5336)